MNKAEEPNEMLRMAADPDELKYVTTVYELPSRCLRTARALSTSCLRAAMVTKVRDADVIIVMDYCIYFSLMKVHH